MKIENIVTIVFILLVLVGVLLVVTAHPKKSIEAAAKQISDNVPGKKAPELTGISGYINTNNQPIKISDYVGKKVILIDFWTYTCINCIRTLPYMRQWDDKYRAQGLQIIGVHSPEFEFEKDYSNVKRAVEENGLNYPVVLDNDHATWNAYDNHYWPAKYLIDKNGNIVYTHFGEGNYAETEKKIKELLADLKNASIEENIAAPEAEGVDFAQIGTPELYFGYQFRRSSLGNEPQFMEAGKTYDFTAPQRFTPNAPYLDGSWKNNEDNFELVSNSGKVILYYKAKNVNIVAGSNSGSSGSIISVKVDGKETKNLTVSDFDLYRVVNGSDYEPHVVELAINGKGFRIYTFTFG